MADGVLGQLGEAFVLLRADGSKLSDDMKKEKDKLEKDLEEMGESTKKVGAALSVGITAPIIAMGAAAVAAGLQIDEALDNIRITTGATGDELEGLENSFKGVFADVPDSASNVSTAIADLNQRLGLTGEALEERATQMLTLSRITKTDLSANIAESSRLFQAWGIDVKDQGQFLDYLFKVSQKTGIGVSTLMQNLGQAAPMLKAFGFSAEQSAAMLGQWEKAGVNAEAMVASLRKAAAQFAQDNIPLKEGLQAVFEKLKTLGPGLEQTSLALDVFGGKAGNEIVAAVNRGQISVDEFVKTLNASPETIMKAADATDGFSEQLEKFRNRAVLAFEPLGTKLLAIGEQLMPMLLKLATIAVDLGESFANLPAPVQEVAIALAAVLAAAGPTVLIAGQLISSYQTVAETFNGVVKTSSMLSSVMPLLGKATLLAGQAALVAGVAWASWKIGEKIGEVTGATDWIGKKLAGALYGVSEAEYDASRAAAKHAETLNQGTDVAKQMAGLEKQLAEATTTSTTATNANWDALKKAGEAKKEAAEEAKKYKEELKQLTEQLSGANLQKEVNLAAAALKAIGGVTKLTKEEAEPLIKTFGDMIDKSKALGQEVPANVMKTYDALFRLYKLPELQKQANADAAKELDRILKEQRDKYEKAMADRNELLVKGLNTATEAEDAYWKLSASKYDIAVDAAAKSRDKQLKEIEPLKTAFPQIYEQARKGILGVYDKMVADAGKAALEAKMKWANDFGAKIGGSILGAMQGGGSVSKAIGGTVGGEIGSKLGKTISTTAGKAIGGTMGGLIGGIAGSIIPGLGTMLGGAVGNWIGGLFGGSKEKKENQAATDQIKATRDELLKTYGTMDNLRMLSQMTGVDIVNSFGNQGKKGLEAFQGDLKNFQDKLQEVSGNFNNSLSGILQGAQGMGFQLPATLQPYFDKLQQMGIISKDNMDLLSSFGDSSEVDYKKMEEAANRYGISLDALGGKFNQAKFNDAVTQILEDYDLLTRGGADVNGVLDGMSDEVSEIAQRAMKLGLSMPENMRPIIQSLIDQGKLLDENGNKITDINKMTFGDPIKVGLDRIAALLETLVTGFGIKLPDAMDKVPTEMDFEFRGRKTGDWPDTGPGDRSPDEMPMPGGEEPPGFDKGGFGDFGSGTLAVLHGQEAVFPLDRLESTMQTMAGGGMDPAALAQAMKDAGMGKQSITLAPNFNGTLANEARAFLREQFIPMIFDVLRDSGELRNEFNSLVE